MSKTAQLIKHVLEKSKQSNTFSRYLKNVDLISAEGGMCKAELKIAEEHLNILGTVHGGLLSALVDSISTYALMSHDISKPGVSVDLHVTFLKAAFPGDVISIDAKTIKAGRRLAFLEVEISKKDDGTLIARGNHTVCIVDSSKNTLKLSI